MSDLIFYTNPMSRGRIARWMLEEVGEPYDVRLVGWDHKPDDLIAANPMAKVPTLIHKVRVVTEGAAIIAYLADVFPDAGLAPTDAERADYYRWMFFAAGPVEAAITDRSLGVTVSDEQKAMVGYGDLDRVIATLKQAVMAHEYIAGDRFTAADVYVGSHIAWGTQFGSLPQCDEFDAYLGRITERPAAVRAREIDDALIAAQQPASGA